MKVMAGWPFGNNDCSQADTNGKTMGKHMVCINNGGIPFLAT